MTVKAALILILSVTATASFADTQVKEQSKDTGRFEIIEDSVSRCSQPPILPMSNGLGFTSIASQFTYKICKEVESAQYEVSGSFWNTDAKKIPGTEKYSYVLAEVTGGQTKTLF
jgi:hypothetical protein